jgi:hypothetical protein
VQTGYEDQRGTTPNAIPKNDEFLMLKVSAFQYPLGL